MTTEHLSGIEGLDVKVGLANCMDDEGLFLEVLKMFAAQIAQDSQTLNEQFNEQSWSDLGKTCHGIKGASASIGATVIQESSAMLEHAGKTGESELINQVYPIFVKQLATIKQQIEQRV